MEIEREIARYVVKELLNRKMPMTFTEFCETINKRLNGPVDKKTILNRLREFSDHFELYERNGQVFVKLVTYIGIFEVHCSKSDSCTYSTCSNLHICKFYALEGKCNYGTNCRYGHDLKTTHNTGVLQVSM